jgi:tripartite-type tricarboxylate transporter receptor subunit TctC
MKLPDVKERLFKEGFESMPTYSPPQFKDFIQKDIAKWSKIIKESNITTD